MITSSPLPSLLKKLTRDAHLILNELSAADLLEIYLHGEHKLQRRRARRLLLRKGNEALPVIEAERARGDLKTLTRTTKLLGRLATPEAIALLGDIVLTPHQPDSAVQFQGRQAAIEALSLAGVPAATDHLREALHRMESLNFDESMAYLLVEALAHSEDPGSPTAFINAKFIPPHFRVGHSASAFSRKMRERMDRACDRMLRDNHAARERLVHSRNAMAFSATTINLGLLSGPIAKVPKYKERALLMESRLTRYLSGERPPDALLIQELWYEKDFEAIQFVARQSGYIPVVQNHAFGRDHGLQILLRRESFIDDPEETGFQFYIDPEQSQTRALFEKVANVKRGVLYARIRLANGTSLVVGNTHLSPLPRFFGLRNRQILPLSRFLKKAGREADYWLLAGDMNIAADYAGSDGSPAIYWELDRFNYLTFQSRTKALDAFRTVNPKEPGYTINPLMAASMFSNKGVSQRLDYLWIKASHSRAAASVEGARIEFTEPLTTQGEVIYLSDHFGVRGDFRLGEIR